MGSSKIMLFRFFLPFFLASFIFLSHPALAQDNRDLENKDVLDYSDAELVEQAKAQEDEKKSQSGKKTPKRKGQGITFGDDSGASLNRDLSMDIFFDNFFFAGLSYMLGADIDGFITVGARIGFPVASGYDAAGQIPGYTAIVGGSLQIEIAISLLNSFIPEFTIVDVEFFLRGGSILGVLLRLADIAENINNTNAASGNFNASLNLNERFNFYYKPTFTMGLNLLFFERFYIYFGMDFGDAMGSRPRLPAFIAPVAGLGFKLGD